MTAETARAITDQALSARGAIQQVIGFVDRRIHAEALQGKRFLASPLSNAPASLSIEQENGLYQHYREAGFKVEHIEDPQRSFWKISWEE